METNKLRNKKANLNTPIIVNDNTIFDNESEAEVFKEYCQTIFQSTPNLNTDIQHFNEINTFITNHPFLYEPIHSLKDATIENLDNSLISPEGIIRVTKNLKILHQGQIRSITSFSKIYHSNP